MGHLLTEPKLKSDKEAGELSESTKTHLIDIYVSTKYERRNDIDNVYVSKGLEVEEDSLTLYTNYTKKLFVKNEERLSNDFICGTPDIIEKDYVIDVKSSWDIFTFFRTKSKKMNPMYYWQLQGYMALTGRKKAKLAYCLIDTPDVLLNDLKRRLLWKMGVISEEDKSYVEACDELDKLHRYSDIPLSERILVYDVEYNEKDIELLYSKIEKARIFLNNIV